MRLKQAAAGRGPGEPLLMMKDGQRWACGRHRILFRKAAETAGLPTHATMYALRHSAITRALLAGVPVRLVAATFDTSVAMIEKTYSQSIADHGDAHDAADGVRCRRACGWQRRPAGAITATGRRRLQRPGPV